MLQALTDAEQGIAPTHWQASRFPEFLRPRIAVAHEGIAMSRACPDIDASIHLSRNDVTLRAGDEVNYGAAAPDGKSGARFFSTRSAVSSA